MEVLFSLVCIFVALVVHEAWGHKLVAERVVGLKPVFISIGIPIEIGKFSTVFFTWERPGKIPVIFSWLIIGGGVGFEDHAYYSVGSYWKKLLMILAGPGINFLMAFLVTMFFVGSELSASLVWSYSMVTLQVIRNAITGVPMDQAFQMYRFIEITVRLGQLTPFWMWLSLFTLWNVSIGVINMIPIPGLDGGQVLAITLIGILGEKVIKPIKMVNMVCFYLMVGLSLSSFVWWFLSLI